MGLVQQGCNMSLTFLDLFAGIGGFRLGLEQAGHKCVGYVELDEFARKSYEAIHDTKNEYTERDVNNIDTEQLPYADIWTFGFPCQDISIAGRQRGFEGNRSSLFFTVTRKLRELKDEKKPTYLVIENVKNLLSINCGWDFARIQIELDEIGYDTEWDVLNSKYFVPQNRERVYIVGHLRGRSTRKVFPITRESESISSEQREPEIVQDGNLIQTESFGGNPQTGRIYSSNGISPTLSCMQGGNLEPKIIIKGSTLPKNANRLGQRDTVYSSEGIMGTLASTDYKQPKQILIKNGTNKGYLEVHPGDGINLSYPDSKARRGRVQKGQTNTLTKSCNLGTVAEDFKIRKLTPKECWRLQGFPDEYFEKAKLVNSDSQLYKQAGNSVTVPVIKAIGEKL